MERFSKWLDKHEGVLVLLYLLFFPLFGIYIMVGCIVDLVTSEDDSPFLIKLVVLLALLAMLFGGPLAGLFRQ